MRNFSLYLLTVLGVALGVASVLAIQIVNRNAIQAFSGGIEAVTGKADLIIESVTPFIPESLFPEVLKIPGVGGAWPILKVDLTYEQEEQQSISVIGLDLSLSNPAIQDSEIKDMLYQEGWTAINSETSLENGWQKGSKISVVYGSRIFELLIGELVPEELGVRPGLALMDIAQLQSLTGIRDVISEIQISLTSEADLDLVKSSLSSLSRSIQILTPLEQRKRAQSLLSAFRLNLTALSLISLLVGAFVIYSSTQASLIRRRTEFGLLRSIGATTGQILSLILAEVLFLGVLGVITGLPLGYWAAQSQIDTVNSTLTNIYLMESVKNLDLQAWHFALAISIGLGSAFFSAILPAADISRKDTKTLLSKVYLGEKISRMSFRLSIIGLLLIGTSGLTLLYAPRDWKPVGFLIGVMILVALPLFSPTLIQNTFGRFRIKSFGAGYSFRSLADRIQTTAFAVSSLAIAVSMLVGITLMIGSFRETVRIWLETTVVADVYVTAKSWRAGNSYPTLDPSLVMLMESVPGVTSVDKLRSITIFRNGRRILVSGVELNGSDSSSRYPIRSGDPSHSLQQLQSGEGILVSEPLARRESLRVNDSFTINTPYTQRSLKISGIYYDYASESGQISMNLDLFQDLFGPGEINTLALYAGPGIDTSELETEIKQRFPDFSLNISRSAEIRERAMGIFDQTFEIVGILQLMSLIIAACAVALTLLILARERFAELALYRVVGAQKSQIFRLYLGKGFGISTLSILLGLIGGTLLAGILVFLINPAYFGWTIKIHIPWNALLAELTLILTAAFLASLYPAFQASQVQASELSRDDL